MAAKNQNPTIYTQKEKRKEPEHNTKESHQNTRKETKRRRKSQRTIKQPENQ